MVTVSLDVADPEERHGGEILEHGNGPDIGEIFRAHDSSFLDRSGPC